MIEHPQLIYPTIVAFLYAVQPSPVVIQGHPEYQHLYHLLHNEDDPPPHTLGSVDDNYAHVPYAYQKNQDDQEIAFPTYQDDHEPSLLS